MKTTFTCKACKVSKKTKLPTRVRSAVDLAMYANHAGMLGIVDTRRGRVLIYCSRECSAPKRRQAKRR